MQHVSTLIALGYLKYCKDKNSTPKFADIWSDFMNNPPDYRGDNGSLVSIETLRNKTKQKDGYQNWRWNSKARQTFAHYLSADFKDVQEDNHIEQSMGNLDLLINSVVTSKKISPSIVESIMIQLIVKPNNTGLVASPLTPPIILTSVDSPPVQIKYGVFLNHDTFLPGFFASAYQNNLINTEFVLLDAWAECLDKFDSGDIQVALHNFPTAISSLSTNISLLFYPFFTFNGYSIFTKKSSLSKVGSNKSFNKLYNFEKKHFLENARVVLETRTDIEWVFKNFCKKYGADYEKISIIDTPINEGRDLFLIDLETDIYCTNTLHTYDLKDNDALELIADASEYTSHRNLNGLIVLKEFYEKNKVAVDSLIYTWFHNANYLKWSVSKLLNSLTNNNLSPEKINFDSFHHNLTSRVSSKIRFEDLLKAYDRHNEFFTSTHEAMDYYKNFLINNLQSSINIAELQLGNSLSYSEQEMQEKLNDLLIKL